MCSAELSFLTKLQALLIPHVLVFSVLFKMLLTVDHNTSRGDKLETIVTLLKLIEETPSEVI